MSELISPFMYDYMLKAMFVSALVGGVCAFLSAYLMLKGWSLMGDALGHAVVPGVAVAYLLQLPYAAGAFVAGLLAALGMALVKQRTRLREDAIIGIVFTTFFAAGLLIASNGDQHPDDRARQHPRHLRRGCRAGGSHCGGFAGAAARQVARLDGRVLR
jgi:ABC-type Mn2+/Zn2+ transport system permease subunit